MEEQVISSQPATPQVQTNTHHVTPRLITQQPATPQPATPQPVTTQPVVTSLPPFTREHFKRRVLTVYTFLSTGLTITLLTVAVLCQVAFVSNFVKNHFIITMLLTSLLMTLNTSMFNRLHYQSQRSSKVMCWALNCILAGIPLLNIDPGVLVKAVLYTVVLILILSLKSFIVPESIVETFLHPLTAIHSLVLVCSVYSILFGFLNNTLSMIITSISLHGGFLVYSGLLMCNTQRLCRNAKHPRFDPMFSAFVLYMNIMNLYSRVAVFSCVETVVVKDCQ